jgi:glycosyltransferase involved in cell wall biosynthesis
MKVSIIVTNYNYGKFISRCLRSCISQNFEKKDYEIIVVDDNSTDESLKILSSFKKNIKILSNKKNIGVAASANKAIKISKGEYFIRVDSDDYISSYTLNFLYSLTEFYPNKFGIASNYALFKDEDRQIMEKKSKEFPIACGILYNKKKFLKYGMYNKNFKHREEEELRIRLDKKYDIYHLNVPLYRYRMHSSNKTKSNNYLIKFKKKIEDLKSKSLKKKIFKSKLLSNVVAILPARGGSKRFKNKNIFNVQGLPMFVWALNEAKKSKLINDLYVTSENEKILKLAKSYGSKIILRPKELSQENTFKIDAIRHAVKVIEKKQNKKVSLVLSIQANSPEIKKLIIENAIFKIIDQNLQEVISVNSDNNCNGALRVMRRNALFQHSLSTNHGFIKTNLTDIHYKKDLKKLSNLWN